ncbi:MAG TPA: DUF6492 family protein [Xanthobacteraceae bacterium]|jgi:hypothetical protein
MSMFGTQRARTALRRSMHRIIGSPPPAPPSLHQIELSAFKACTGLRSTRPGVSSLLPLDVVIPAAAKDSETLPYTVEGVRRNLRHPIGTIFVIGEADEMLCEVVRGIDATFVDENTILPMRRTDIAYTVKGVDRSGWLFQKLLKYAGSTLTRKSHYFVIDSDTVLIRPQVFELEGTPVVLHADEHHEPYFQVCESLLGYPRATELSCVAHMVLFDVARLTALKKHIERRFRCPWFEALVRNTKINEMSGSSDYELYGQWSLSQYPLDNVREYFFNSPLGRARLCAVADLERRYGASYRSLSFHSYQPREWVPPLIAGRTGIDDSGANANSPGA